MKIQTKLIFLLSGFVVVSMILAVLYIKIERGRILALFTIEKNEVSENFDKIMELKGKSIEVFARDYTYWDDMIDFVDTRNMQWAEENIEPGLKTFNANAVWVYNTDVALVYSVNNLEDSSFRDILLPKGALEQLFSKNNRFCHFFADTSKGLIEVFGATIHPTIDSERKTDPHGFYLVGRLWDKQYIAELSKLTSANIIISTAAEDYGAAPDINQEVIYFSKILSGWDGMPIAHINIRITSNIVKNLKQSSRQLAFLVFIFVALNSFVFLFFLQRWINFPLHLISLSFGSEDPKLLNTLRSRKDEFGGMAKLIHEFFEQKKKLVREIEERKLVEDELRRSEARFSDIAASAGDWIWEVDVDGVYIYSSIAVEQILGYKPEEMIGKHFYDFFHPNEKERLKKEAFEVFAKKSSFKNFTNLVIGKNGSELIMETSGAPITGADGRLIGYRGVDHDITERKKKENEERNRMQELEIFHNASIGREERIIELKNKIKELEAELKKKGGSEYGVS